MNFDKKEDVRIAIQSIEKRLNENNVWQTKYNLWGSAWATMQMKNLASKEQKYLFIMQWMPNFPQNFQIICNDEIFKPTQAPMISRQHNMILFHAIKCSKSGE